MHKFPFIYRGLTYNNYVINKLINTYILIVCISKDTLLMVAVALTQMEVQLRSAALMDLPEQ